MSLMARDVTVRVGRKTLIENVSLQAEQGELLVILGANGAGKTTLMKTLSGELHPASGEIHMGGQALSRWSLRERAKVRGILPQSSTLSFPFTAREVVLMGRTPHVKGVEQAIDYTIVQEAMHITGTDHLQDQIYTTLSGGERQRVQLARVLAQIWQHDEGYPRYLLVDEPTNNLDLAYQQRTLAIIQQFAREGAAVIAILHDLNLAAQYADRVMLMKTGHCVASGTPAAAFTPENIHDVFNIDVMIQPHPMLECPLVIPIPTA